MFHFFMGGFRHRGFYFELRSRLEPRAEEIGGAKLVKKSAFHDPDPLLVSTQRNITIGRRLVIKRAAKVIHHGEQFLQEGFAVHCLIKFQSFQPFKLFKPPPLSSPATRGRMKEGVGTYWTAETI